MSKRTKTLLRWSLAIGIVTVVGYFFARSLSRNWEAIQDVDITFDGWLVVVVLLFTLTVITTGVLWGHMTEHLARVPIPTLEAIRVQALSWILKYIPGQVSSAFNKVVWAADRGISKTLVLITFVYENLFLLIGSLVPPVIILLVMGTVPVGESPMLLISLLALVPMFLLTYKPVFRFFVNILAKRLIKNPVPEEFFLPWVEAMGYQLAYLIPRIINGVGFALMAWAVLDIPPVLWLPLACAYIVAGAVGILAIFVPSGIGVRESVIVLLAQPFIPVEQAIILSLLARLIATLADAVVALVYGALKVSLRREVVPQ